MDRHQGGNLYPYFSEVIRSGVPKKLFAVGCSIGLIPTLIFVTNYFNTMVKFSKTFHSFLRRSVFLVMEVIQLLLFYYSAFSVIGVAYCDMDLFPDEHTLFSSTWVLFTNLLEVIQFFQVKSTFYKGSRMISHGDDRIERQERSYTTFKACLSLFSILGMINFVVLGSYRPCHCRKWSEFWGVIMS